MSGVSTPYEASGRTQQKSRTRSALLAAARDLVTGGATPTVEQAATRAGVSRTTAYRYFPTQRELLVAAHPEVGASSLLPDPPPTDVEARLETAVRAFLEIVVGTEAQQRTMLRLSLTADAGAPPTDLPLRQGRAIAWFEEALAPLLDQMTPADVRRLAVAIRSAVGVESLVWLTDIGRLGTDEALEVMTWSARSMLHAAMGGNLPPGARRSAWVSRGSARG